MKTWLSLVALVLLMACDTTVESTDTGSTTSSSSGSGGSGSGGSGSGGIASFECGELRTQYDAEMADARQCDPNIDVEQCTLEFAADLLCSCPTYINPANGDAIDRMEALAAEYRSQQCNPGVVCDCAAPVGGTCQPQSGGSGACEDNY